jgi:hypothetical protein
MRDTAAGSHRPRFFGRGSKNETGDWKAVGRVAKVTLSLTDYLACRCGLKGALAVRLLSDPGEFLSNRLRYYYGTVEIVA